MQVAGRLVRYTNLMPGNSKIARIMFRKVHIKFESMAPKTLIK